MLVGVPTHYQYITNRMLVTLLYHRLSLAIQTVNILHVDLSECMGAVLQGDGSWLYDHWRRGSDLHSDVIIEMTDFNLFYYLLCE